MTVSFYPEDLAAVDRALSALHAERQTLDRWNMHSVDLTLAIDDLESFRDRLKTEQDTVRETFTTRRAYPELKAV